MLNDDVLLFVLSWSSRKTATSMIATCHFLYHEGVKVVLHDRPLVFDSILSEHNALSLLRFVQAEPRCSYVRKLFVSMQPMPAAIAQSLAGLLPRMTSLESLFLNVEDALQSYPTLLSAFASLRFVKDLIVNGAERSCALIGSLQVQFVSTRLYFSPQSPESGQRPGLYLNPDFHPLVLLQRSALTLKTLTCGFWCDMDPKIFFCLPKVRYPNMHAFTLYECQNPQGLTPCMNCFPNLARLTVDASLLPRNLILAHAELAIIQRDMNLSRQGPSPPSASLSWKSLHDYTGHLVELWFLGLACPIPRLILEDTPPRARPTRSPTSLTLCAQRSSRSPSGGPRWWTSSKPISSVRSTRMARQA